MKSHTSEFKEEIKTLGKQQSVRITYTLNDEQIILTDEDINSATPNYEASLLKSVMKVLELDSNVSIPKGTEIKFEYGLLVNGAYEYLDYGNYIVAKEPEKQEDTLSYKITCYDKMLYSMKDYEHIDITYPCTIKQYLVALCNKIGLQFKDSDFANANRQITNELFMTINEDGTYSSMGYTYRDVLDQIAETTGGCICMTLDDKVEVRYVNKTINYEQSEKSNIIQFKTEVEEPIILERLEGKSIQATRSGKNLLNLLKCSFSRCTLNSDNKSLTCSINNFYYAYVKTTELNNWLLQNKGKKITFSTGTTLEGKNTGIVIYGTRSDGSTYQEANETGTGKCSITIADDFTAITSIELRFNRQSTIFTDTTTVINYAMLELGAVATDYEEYGVMPSPDYPSEIKSLGDEGTLTIEQRGKNYLNVPSNYVLKGYQTINLNLPAGNYLINWEDITTDGTDKNMLLNFFYEDETTYSRYISPTYTSKQLELKATKKIIKVNIYSQSGYNVSKDITTTFKKLMISEDGGSYEPYFSKDYVIPLSAPLRSLPNGSKDTIEEDGIHRRYKEFIFTGTEAIINRGKVNNVYRYNVEFITDISIGYKKAICTHFKQTDVENFANINEVCFTTHPTQKVVSFFTNFTTLDEFKTFLAEQYANGTPMKIVYELAEEVVEPFTDEQLEVINSIETQIGTNIFELESNAILNYPVNYDTINEEYINDTNVNFGEKYRTN